MAIKQPRKIPLFEREAFYTDFPNLNGKNHKVTSPATPAIRFPKKPYLIYNCLGMAVGDERRVWWPGGRGYWPRQPSEDTVEELAFILSTQFKFRNCDNAEYEPTVRKLAIFADAKNVPQHVAFQPKYSGSPHIRWKSKMGMNVDIEHQLLAVCSDLYGHPVKLMCRDLED